MQPVLTSYSSHSNSTVAACVFSMLYSALQADVIPERCHVKGTGSERGGQHHRSQKSVSVRLDWSSSQTWTLENIWKRGSGLSLEHSRRFSAQTRSQQKENLRRNVVLFTAHRHQRWASSPNALESPRLSKVTRSASMCTPPLLYHEIFAHFHRVRNIINTSTRGWSSGDFPALFSHGTLKFLLRGRQEKLWLRHSLSHNLSG